MPMSPYLAGLRAKVGSDLLLLPSVCGCVFDGSGRLLLARHGDVGLWAAPGGMLDPDERPEEAVVRELREELGVEVEVRGVIGVYSGPEFHAVYPNGHRCQYMIAVYGCALASGVPQPDGDEITDYRWVTEEELAGLAMTPWSPRVLPEVFAWWRGQTR
ncbi:NUDIX domain-containing protein [Nonomuraea roseoviolacea subsp. roseoviolacea]|uniref:ADP-ribose pyrophosphatase YjhB (NUDIX family) n=1 Tax=Nonomuraea roseoviolacea subsp. carminata TaxID=160689 RepID=A0ABT1JSW1_9ACTN|nr:NUDIX domain-containing protein [Nonomuraea roseoviolacea]MCP2344810.1 ADP-ribose pyrophosphatase YjhB (NUDIX family) [Nonomuraea roseoviolacea subsp. carminata]